MALEKKHFPIYILLLLLVFSLQSCDKKQPSIPEKKNNLIEINRLIALGDKCFEKEKYDSSFYYFNKAKSLCDPEKDISKIIYSISNLAIIQQIHGDYAGCETTVMEDTKKFTVYRVLQELLVNMKKHSECSLAVITFKKIENKLQIDYSDNGLGAAFDKINLKNELLNVENRILAIKGTITFETKSNSGFRASISLPI